MGKLFITFVKHTCSERTTRASWVDLNIADSLFGEKKQARPLAGKQLPCLLLVLLDRLTLLALICLLFYKSFSLFVAGQHID